MNLLETETGLVVQLERDGQLIERSCAGTCGDVGSGCLLEACQLSGIPSLCNAAADACENRCNACSGINTRAGTCEAPSYPAERGASSADPNAADPNAATPNAESNSGQNSGESSGQGSGSYY